jgi:beta-galactosidase
VEYDLWQIENEYGFCWREPDRKYLEFLEDKVHQYLGSDALIYTTDPPSVIQKGSLPGKDVYS